MILFLNVLLADFVQCNTKPCGEEIASCATLSMYQMTHFFRQRWFSFSTWAFFYTFLFLPVKTLSFATPSFYMLSVIIINPSIHSGKLNVDKKYPSYMYTLITTHILCFTVTYLACAVNGLLCFPLISFLSPVYSI